MARVTVIPHREVKGGVPSPVVSHAALLRNSPGRDYLRQCVAPFELGTDCPFDEGVRAVKPGARNADTGSPWALLANGIYLAAQSITLDVDLPGKQTWGQISPDLAQALFHCALEFGQAVGHADHYTTPHGFHVVVYLPKPIPIGIHGYAFEKVAEEFRVWFDDILKSTGTKADHRCRDWTHLYACPAEGTVIQEVNETAKGDVIGLIDRSLAAFDPFAELTAPAPALAAAPAIPDDEPECPEDLDLARAALPLNVQAALLADLSVYDSARHNRLLEASHAIIRSLAGTPYFTFDHVYWLLRQHAIDFGEHHAGVTYLSELKEMITSGLPKEQSADDLLSIIDGASTKTALPAEALAPPVSVAPREESGPSADFITNVYSWNKHLPPGLDMPKLLTVLEQNKELLLRHPDKPLFKPLTRSGFYLGDWVSMDALASVINALSFPGHIQLFYMTKGDEKTAPQLKPKAVHQIIAEYCTIVGAIELCKFGWNGPVLVRSKEQGRMPHLNNCPVRRNPKLSPRGKFYPDVREWLEMSFGDNLPTFLRAITPFARPEDGPTAGVFIIGHPGCGKSLMAQGCQTFFDPSTSAPASVLTTQWQNGLSKNVLIWADEGINPGRDRILADEYRRLFDTLPEELNMKMGALKDVQIPHRFLATSNDDTIARMIIGDRPLNADARLSLAQRMVLFHVPETVSLYLTGKGGRAHTAQWIEGEMRLANHLLYELYNGDLYEMNSDGSIVMPVGNRFIFEGAMTPELDHIMGESCDPREPLIVEGLAKMFRAGQTNRSIISPFEQGVWVVTAELFRAADPDNRSGYTIATIGRMIGQMSVRSKKSDGTRFYLIPFHAIAKRFVDWGITPAPALQTALNAYEGRKAA